MSQVKYVKILLFFFIFIISFQAEAKRKKKKKKAKIEKAEKATAINRVSPADSNIVKAPKATTGVTTTIQKSEEIKPFAQLVVSFSSMGAGINAKARQAFLDHIAWFNTQNHCELMYDRKSWGREGEVDYCFVGNNQILIPVLYKQLKEKFNGERQVFINENFPCK